MFTQQDLKRFKRPIAKEQIEQLFKIARGKGVSHDQFQEAIKRGDFEKYFDRIKRIPPRFFDLPKGLRMISKFVTWPSKKNLLNASQLIRLGAPDTPANTYEWLYRKLSGQPDYYCGLTQEFFIVNFSETENAFYAMEYWARNNELSTAQPYDLLMLGTKHPDLYQEIGDGKYSASIVSMNGTEVVGYDDSLETISYVMEFAKDGKRVLGRRTYEVGKEQNLWFLYERLYWRG